jgi:hypothetical protein
MFGSIYSKLRVQITPTRAVQFHEGRYWTDDPQVAEALRRALRVAVAGVHHGGRRQAKDTLGYEHAPGTCGWEIVTAADLERLQAATAVVERRV